MSWLDPSDGSPPKKKRKTRPCRSKRNNAKRLKLLKLDPYCHYCGKKLNKNEATLDHKKPRAKGGTDRFDNVVLACRKCNCLKADKSYEEFRSQIIVVAGKTASGKPKPQVKLVELVVSEKKPRRKKIKNSTLVCENEESLIAELNRLLSLLS